MTPESPLKQSFIPWLVYGAIFGMIIVLLLSQSIQHKQDKKVVRMFEKRFPDESSWKQKGTSLLEKEGLA
jgi:hypothetical protein